MTSYLNNDRSRIKTFRDDGTLQAAPCEFPAHKIEKAGTQKNALRLYLTKS
ncbi:hypothetical protein [Candidatus Avelusimicrobium sp.]|uniref:hypothetical protein n=1 Tax=Candidatus Avelusimicrobium sp. TaxID=3048833 RepID=UPI003D7ED9D9